MTIASQSARPDLSGFSGLTVSYGSYTFGPATQIVSFKTKPIPDRAGRTFSALEHTMTVKFWLYDFDADDPSQATLDMDVPAIRAQLMKPADNLTILSTTFGNYTINATGASTNPNLSATSLKDLIWGPMPRLLDQTGFNSFGAACTWEVSFSLDPCGGAVKGKVLEWNYGVDFNIDASGYTTRVVKGSVSIPMTRKAQDDGTLVDQADRLREDIEPPIPTGFRRTSRSFPLSEDKRTLNYTFTDEQMPNNIPPPDVVFAEASHTAGTDPKNLVDTVNTIRASYELTLKKNRRDAWSHFQALIADRLQNAMKSDSNWTFLPRGLHFSEPEIYGRKSAEFSLSYTLIWKNTPKTKGTGLANAILAVFGGGAFFDGLGLYRQAPESNWKLWNNSMALAKVSTPRGTAQLKFQTSDDVIVDLCLNTSPKKIQTAGVGIASGGAGSAQTASRANSVLAAMVKRFSSPAASGGNNGGIDPNVSFLDYKVWLEIRQTDNNVVLQPLPTAPVLYQPPLKNAWDVTGYNQPYNPGTAPAAIVQTRGAPLYVLTLTGYAVRAAYDIAPPQLVSIFGQKPAPFNDQSCYFRCGVVANWGVPIVAASWRFRYVLAAPPIGPIVAPPNPMLGDTTLGLNETGLGGFVTSQG